MSESYRSSGGVIPAPRLSIGVPVKDGENYLAEALESIRSQTFTDFEVLISDNASSDRTGEICREFADADNRFHYQRQQQRIGIADNWNIVFQRANAPYFKWVAHDDRMEPTFFERCVEALDRDPDLVLAHPTEREIDGEGRFLPLGWQPTQKSDSARACVRFRYLCYDHPCYPVFGVIRADALKRTGLHGRYPSSDRVLLAELALYGRFLKLQEPLFLHREHRGRVGLADRLQDTQGHYTPDRPDTLTLPHFRMAWEFCRAISRSPVRSAERACCYFQVSRWVVSGRRRLMDDLAFYVRKKFAGRGARGRIHG